MENFDQTGIRLISYDSFNTYISARELKCPQNLSLPANAVEIYYDDLTGRAEAICEPNYFVDRTKGPIKSKCKKIKQAD